MILVDTGPLVARSTVRTRITRTSVSALATAKPARLVPGLIIADSYLLACDAGSTVEAAFQLSLATDFLTLPGHRGHKR